MLNTFTKLLDGKKIVLVFIDVKEMEARSRKIIITNYSPGAVVQVDLRFLLYAFPH